MAPKPRTKRYDIKNTSNRNLHAESEILGDIKRKIETTILIAIFMQTVYRHSRVFIVVD